MYVHIGRLCIMILAIFLYIAYVHNEILTPSNGIFTCLGQVDVEFFYLCVQQACSHVC